MIRTMAREIARFSDNGHGIGFAGRDDVWAEEIRCTVLNLRIIRKDRCGLTVAVWLRRCS
jgi:hypothetical protein